MEIKKAAKIIGVFFFILFLSFIVFNYAKNTNSEKEVSYNEFINLLDENEISQVVIEENYIKINPKKNSEYNGKVLYTANMNDPKLIPKLENLKVSYSIIETKYNPNLILVAILIGLVVVIYTIYRKRFIERKSN